LRDLWVLRKRKKEGFSGQNGLFLGPKMGKIGGLQLLIR